MVPFISVHSQRGLIGIESERGRFDIRRPQPDLHVSSTDAVVYARNRPGVLQVDQRLTNNALTGGKPEAFWSRIYSQYQAIARQNVQRIVEEGNRMGDLRAGGNPIAELAHAEYTEGAPDLQVFGPATPVNIRFRYTPNDPSIEVVPGDTTVEAQTYRPEIQFTRGDVNIYMQQYPKVTITPPVVNLMA